LLSSCSKQGLLSIELTGWLVLLAMQVVISWCFNESNPPVAVKGMDVSSSFNAALSLFVATLRLKPGTWAALACLPAAPT
jgi:hypothetical protein